MTSSQTSRHLRRQANGRPQTTQIFRGRSPFFRIRATGLVLLLAQQALKAGAQGQEQVIGPVEHPAPGSRSEDPPRKTQARNMEPEFRKSPPGTGDRTRHGKRSVRTCRFLCRSPWHPLTPMVEEAATVVRLETVDNGEDSSRCRGRGPNIKAGL